MKKLIITMAITASSISFAASNTCTDLSNALIANQAITITTMLEKAGEEAGKVLFNNYELTDDSPPYN